jgi:arylsulfatase A-like enzyme
MSAIVGKLVALASALHLLGSAAAAAVPVGRLLTVFENAGLRSRTMVFLSADHGGVGAKHGGLTPAEIEIPWIVEGPTVRRGHEIKVPVSTVDMAPTVMFALGERSHEAWIGRPVLEAFAIK